VAPAREKIGVPRERGISAAPAREKIGGIVASARKRKSGGEERKIKIEKPI
jgi:hypothetical protein